MMPGNTVKHCFIASDVCPVSPVTRSVIRCTLKQLANSKGEEVTVDLFMLPKASLTSCIIQNMDAMPCL